VLTVCEQKLTRNGSCFFATLFLVFRFALHFSLLRLRFKPVFDTPKIRLRSQKSFLLHPRFKAKKAHFWRAKFAGVKVLVCRVLDIRFFEVLDLMFFQVFRCAQTGLNVSFC